MKNVTSRDLAKSLTQRLKNYKLQQTNIAKQKGCYDQLMAANTLTQARKIVYGTKTKNCSGYRGHPEWSK
jgi:hypothetical protein